VRAILAGDLPPGARPALALPLAAIEAELEPYAIETWRESPRADRCLVREAIGARQFEALPAALRAFHALDAPVVWTGRAVVEAGTNPIARLVARAIGLPATGNDVTVTVVTARMAANPSAPPVERWTRRFAGRCFASELAVHKDGSVTERFGPFTFEIGLRAGEGKLHFPVTAWRLGGLRLPLKLAPRSDAHEWQDENGRFNFDVKLTLPVFGMLAHYRGWLEPRVRSGLAAQRVGDLQGR
jgi:hypothetical protein